MIAVTVLPRLIHLPDHVRALLVGQVAPPRSAGALDAVPVISLHFPALLRTGHALQLPPSRIPGGDGGGDGGGHHRHGQR